MDTILTTYERLSRKSLEVERLERELATLREQLNERDTSPDIEPVPDTVPRAWLDKANAQIERKQASIGSLCDALQGQITENERLKGRIAYDKAHHAPIRATWRTSALVTAGMLGASVTAAVMLLTR